MLLFLLILFSFALAYLLAFGAGLEDFRNLEMTVYTMLRSLLGRDTFDEMWDENRLLGPLFYFLWTILGLFIMFSMMIVVLCQAIAEHSGAEDVFAGFNRVVRSVAHPISVAYASLATRLKRRPGKKSRRRMSPPPPLLVLTGHAASLTPY